MNRAQELYELSNPQGKPWAELGMKTVGLWTAWASRIKQDPMVVPQPQGEIIQARVLVQAGYMAGIDMALLIDHQLLGKDWGGPDPDLLVHPNIGAIVLNLEHAYHSKQDPTYDDKGFSLTLSFDTLYRCVIPWEAIVRVSFSPEAPQGPEVA